MPLRATSALSTLAFLFLLNGCSDDGTVTLPAGGKTTPTATISPVSVVYGTATATLTASVAFTGSAIPTGAVTITVNGSANGVGTVTCTGTSSPLSCSAPYTVGTLTPGAYPIAANFAGDTHYNPATASGTLTITQATPTVTSMSPSVTYGTSSATLSASVAYTGTAAPSGALSFTVNGSATGVSTVTCTGSTSPLACTASYSTGSLVVGTDSIAASLASDANYVTASGSGTLTVTQATPTVKVTAVSVGSGTSSTTLAASIAYAGSAAPTGTVSFTVNGSATGVSSIACTGTSSPLSCTATYANPSLATGTYTLAVGITADTNYAAASGTNNYVVALPSLTLTVTPLRAVVGSTASSTLQLTVTIPWTVNRPNFNVSFTVNGSSTNISHANCYFYTSTGPMVCISSFDGSSLALGTYPIVATIAADSHYAQSTGTADLIVEVQPGVSTGLVPVANAHVHLLAAATSGFGAASTSVLTSGQTGQSDTAGPYVQADANGLFSLPDGVSCTAGQQMYFYASGGTISGTANSAATFMAPVGVCQPTKAGGVVPSISTVINEVTTIATAYALSGFATDPLHVADDEGVGGNTTASLAAVGMNTAFATPFNLETAGVALSTTPAGNGNVPQAGINTVADILAACNESASSASTACSTVFNNMMSGGATGTAATDTATAAIYFAHNPYPGATQMTNLYGNDGSSSPAVTTPYTPTLGQLPNDWSIAIYYSTTSANANPFDQGVPGLVVDPVGNIWLAEENRITELNSLGVEISPLKTGYGAGSIFNAPFGMASDSTGNIWIANCFDSNVIELSPSGSVLSPMGGFTAGGFISSPNSLAFDPAGMIWIMNVGTPGMVQMDPATGNELQDLTNTVAGGNGIGIDSLGDIWNSNSTMGTLQEFSNAGVLLSGANGYSTPDYRQEYPPVIDANNNVWISNYNGLLFKFIGSTGAGTEYTAGGLSAGFSIAVDGGNHIWIGSGIGDIVEYNSNGTAISPTTTNGYNGNIGGFQGMGGNIDSPGNVMVDQAGNVWTYSGDNGTVTESIGIGSPTVAPLASATKYNKIGQRP